MAERTGVDLIDKLDWRVQTLTFLTLYADTEQGEPNADKIRECMGMLLLEMQTILNDHGKGEDSPGHEGPLGPLPPDLADALE